MIKNIATEDHYTLVKKFVKDLVNNNFKDPIDIKLFIDNLKNSEVFYMPNLVVSRVSITSMGMKNKECDGIFIFQYQNLDKNKLKNLRITTLNYGSDTLHKIYFLPVKPKSNIHSLYIQAMNNYYFSLNKETPYYILEKDMVLEYSKLLLTFS